MSKIRTAVLAGGVLVLSSVGGGCGKSSSAPIPLPKVYPPVRASTPDALIADSAFSAPAGGVTAKSALQRRPNALDDAVSLATVVQERLYTMGPTEILRLVSGLDERTSTLDTRASEHPCLTGTPIPYSYSLPGGATFNVSFQCLQEFSAGGVGTGWLVFGFDNALAAPVGGGGASGGDGSNGGTDGKSSLPDGGALGTDGGGDHFYLAEGQSSGMGSVYRFDRTTGDVEGWVSVADNMNFTGSRVMMHLITDTAAGTFELTLGGAAVGFCAAHLKTGADFMFIDAKTMAPPPGGTPMSADTQYCDTSRTGCFDTRDLTTDLGGDAPACAGLVRSTFAIATDLDASSDPGANVTPNTVYTYFGTEPTGIPTF